MGKLHSWLIALLLPFAAFTFGQSVTLSLGSGTGTPGGTASVTLNLATSGGASPAALEFTFNYSSDITGVSVVAGSSATSAGKSVSCSGTTCLVWGMGSTAISAGPVAVATFQIAANPSTTTIPVQVNNVVISSCLRQFDSGLRHRRIGLGNLRPTAHYNVLIKSNLQSYNLLYPRNFYLYSNFDVRAGTGGFSVPISTNNSSLSLPGTSVLVPAGQSSFQFTASAAQLSATQSAVLTAGTGSGAKTASFTSGCAGFGDVHRLQSLFDRLQCHVDVHRLPE